MQPLGEGLPQGGSGPRGCQLIWSTHFWAFFTSAFSGRILGAEEIVCTSPPTPPLPPWPAASLVFYVLFWPPPLLLSLWSLQLVPLLLQGGHGAFHLLGEGLKTASGPCRGQLFPCAPTPRHSSACGF